MKVGIVGYGSYIPEFRIKVDEIANVWDENPVVHKNGIRVYEKSVPDLDEDTITLSVEASRNAVRMWGGDPKDIGAVYVGSESHPFAVYPTASTVAEAIRASPDLTASDLEFACKAGTAGVQAALGLVSGGIIDVGLGVGTDCAQGRPRDALEYTAGAGGCAWLIGKENILAEIEGTCSVTTDTPDFWRREGQDFPSHSGRFTGKPSYMHHTISCTKKMMNILGYESSDFDYVVFHQPNGSFPRNAARQLNFSEEQIKLGLAVEYIGNTYSAASMIGLARVLDHAEPGDRILVTSYGSGAGSDAFSMVATDLLPEKRSAVRTTDSYIDQKRYLNYANYAKHRRLYKSM